MLTMRTTCPDGPKNSSAQPGLQGPLDVRHRLVLRGDGTPESHANVRCPEREHALPLEECTQCDRCAGLYHDATQGRSRVLCGAVSDGEFVAASTPVRGHEADDEPAMNTPIAAIMARDVVCVRPELTVE